MPPVEVKLPYAMAHCERVERREQLIDVAGEIPDDIVAAIECAVRGGRHPPEEPGSGRLRRAEEYFSQMPQINVPPLPEPHRHVSTRAESACEPPRRT